ncbi:Dimethylmenaquinone methyltransferase [uncultured delta proteobacterium]|uniref:Regulator of ribonuclease activity homolog n=1 Tax=uncultured delta proteobacterium TaxID=34034 RepID=A0A212JBW1_9DELT|nr:Dimethylmenaquinone methyltransferase [uncultured delta proteobacterium]
MANPGLRVKMSFTRPDPALVKQFAGIPVANIGDNMNRINCMNARVRPMNSAPLLGCAFTVKVRAGDNLLFHKAIDMAQPGDIVVIDAQNEQSYAIFGELMIMWLRRRGVTGVVVDGCIRDYDAISQMKEISVYATGITPNGPLKEGGGEINFPVMCGGLIVNPGDIIVGDSDGIVVINPADAADVLAKAKAQNAKEAKTMTDIENLAWDRAWVDAALKAKGCEFIA